MKPSEAGGGGAAALVGLLPRANAPARRLAARESGMAWYEWLTLGVIAGTVLGFLLGNAVNQD